MINYPALARLRIGCVRYLNAKPLIHDYLGPIQLEHPFELARHLAGGELDAALVPVFESFRGDDYLFVDGVAIASRGPVYSVFLAYRGKLPAIRRIALDPASLTSVHLLQVLLREYHGLRPECVRGTMASAEAEAQLLIGNQAIEFREQAPDDFEYLDLGEEWTRQTGLPFVYALWLLRAEVADAPAAAEEFRKLKAAGLRDLERIIAKEEAAGSRVARRYLTEHIRFDLGPEEKAGIELFRSLARKHGFAPGNGAFTYV